MQIKKQEVNVGKAVFEGEIKSVTDGSIIVPDIKPDILKILQVDADAVLEEKSMDNGKAIFKGKVYVNVLYVPESENGRVECIKGCFEFFETVKRSEFAENMYVTAVCDTKKVGYKLINSRKIGIEAYVGINICITEKDCVTFISEIEDDNCQLQKDTITLNPVGEKNEFTFNIDENVILNCDNVVDILKSNITISEKEYRSLTGKVVVKGKIQISVLYVTEDNKYGHFDFDIPFTEVLDSDKVIEDSECDISYNILKSEIKLVGCEENKYSISTYLEIQVLIDCMDCTNIEYIKDCYFVDSECTVDYTDINCEEVIGRPNVSTILKSVLEKDEKLPDILDIYATLGKPYINSTDIEDGRIIVSGKVIVYLLYMSGDSKNPLASITEEIPFNQIIDCEKASRECEVLLHIDCEHIGYKLTGVNNVEISYGIGIKGKIIKKQNVKVINDISTLPVNIKDKSLVVYFVKEGDTIWNIGKKYRVKYQDISMSNGLDSEELIPGQKIIIPVTK